MRLCVGTAKGIVMLDTDRSVPRMVLADPPSVWCLGRDCQDPQLLYAGSIHNSQAGSARGKGSLARSSDGGRTWNDITPRNARDEEVWAIATAPDVSRQVFVGTSHARLFASDNGGQTFVECTALLKMAGRDRWTAAAPPHVPHIRSIRFDPRQPDSIYIAVEEGGVFRSRDRGETFEPLSHRIDPDVHEIAIDSEDSSRLYATTGAGLFMSTSGGASWKRINGFERDYMVPLLVRSRRDLPVYTAGAAGPPPTWSVGGPGADAIVYRSADRGESFTPLPAADGHTFAMRAMLMRLISDPTDDAIVYGAMSDGTILRINEHAENLEVIADRLPPAYDLLVLPQP